MGGSGSGWRRGRKLTVEECAVLHTSALAFAYFSGDGTEGRSHTPGTITFQCTRERVAGDSPALRLKGITLPDGIRLIPAELLRLVATRPYFGGVRWWVVCPGCGSRAGKLYLPPGRCSLRCRKCHGLTYRSVQTHDKRYDLGGMAYSQRVMARWCERFGYPSTPGRGKEEAR